LANSNMPHTPRTITILLTQWQKKKSAHRTLAHERQTTDEKKNAIPTYAVCLSTAVGESSGNKRKKCIFFFFLFFLFTFHCF